MVSDWNEGPRSFAATTLSALTACAPGVDFIRSHRRCVFLSRSTMDIGPMTSDNETNVQSLHSAPGARPRNGMAMAARTRDDRRARGSERYSWYLCSAPARHAHTTSFTVHPILVFTSFRLLRANPGQLTMVRFPE